jgi:hypothetical protein
MPAGEILQAFCIRWFDVDSKYKAKCKKTCRKISAGIYILTETYLIGGVIRIMTYSVTIQEYSSYTLLSGQLLLLHLNYQG